MENQEIIQVSKTQLMTIILRGDIKELITYRSSLTLDQARETGNQLSGIKKEKGEKDTVKMISFLIATLNESLNINTKMNEFQVLETAICIMNEYWYLTIEDVCCCFKMVQRGGYGITYQIDQQRIFDWLSKYDTSRDAIAETKAEKYKEPYENKRSSTDKTLRETMKEMQAKFVK